MNEFGTKDSQKLFALLALIWLLPAPGLVWSQNVPPGDPRSSRTRHKLQPCCRQPRGPWSRRYSTRSGLVKQGDIVALSSSSVATHSSYSEGDHHCPLRLSGLPAAHTLFWVIPQRPAPYFTVHSVGCLQPTPSSEWFLKARTLFHLVSEWFLKAQTLFHRSFSEMQLVQDSVKKSCTHQDSVKKICSICFINFACGAIFSSKILRHFVSVFQFPCRK